MRPSTFSLSLLALATYVATGSLIPLAAAATCAVATNAQPDGAIATCGPQTGESLHGYFVDQQRFRFETDSRILQQALDYPGGLIRDSQIYGASSSVAMTVQTRLNNACRAGLECMKSLYHCWIGTQQPAEISAETGLPENQQNIVAAVCAPLHHRKGLEHFCDKEAAGATAAVA